MILGRVVGHGTSTVKHRSLGGVRMLVVEPIGAASLDPILALGAIVADELYGRFPPVVVVPEEAFAALADGDEVAVEPDGTVEVRRAGEG